MSIALTSNGLTAFATILFIALARELHSDGWRRR